MVPALAEHIAEAVGHFEEAQQDNEDLNEMIIIADLDKKIFAFALAVIWRDRTTRTFSTERKIRDLMKQWRSLSTFASATIRTGI